MTDYTPYSLQFVDSNALNSAAHDHWALLGYYDYTDDPNIGLSGGAPFYEPESDILFRNTVTGTLMDWTVSNLGFEPFVEESHLLTVGGVVAAPDASWHIAMMSDFNGDGKSDMLWQNTNGSLIDWTLNSSSDGAQIASSQSLTLGGNAVAPDASWQMVGAAGQDFNGDHKTDLLWRNSNSGELIDWTMNGAQIASSQPLTLGGSLAAPDASWKIAAVADLNSDGKSDLLWRSSVTNQLVEWAMNGSQIMSSASITLGGVLATPGSSWSITGAGAGNISWQNTDGSHVNWTMNGSQIAQMS